MTMDKDILFFPIWFLSKFVRAVYYLAAIIVFAIFFIVTYTYKQIAVLLIKIQYRDAVLLSSTDTCVSYGESVESKLMLFSAVLYGTIDINLFRSILLEKVVKVHPKFQCYVDEKYGYYFRTNEENFNINQHVIELPDMSISTKKEWEKVQRDLYYNKAISHGRSPWMVYFVPLNPGFEGTNGEPCFYIVTAVYHNICDGYSGMHLINAALDEEEIKPIVSKQTKFSLATNWLDLLSFPSRLPSYILQNFSSKRKIFDSDMLSGEVISFNGGIIKTQTVKDIRKALDIPFKVILLTAIMNALEKFFERTFDHMPEEITISVPQVHWSIDDEIKPMNKFSLLYLRLPFNNKFCMDRLKEINEILNNSQTKDNFSFHYFAIQYLGNFIPSIIGKKLYKGSSNSAMLSVAGMEKNLKSMFRNRKPLGSIQRLLSVVENIGFLFSAITIEETISFSIQSRSTITTEDGLQRIMLDIRDTIEELKQHALNDNF